MNIKNEWIISQEHRKSTRTYIDRQLKNSEINKLEILISEINNEDNLNFQLINNCKDLFNSFKASYGFLKGVNTCIALVANKNISGFKVKSGYYGEMLVLEATSLNLATCWIGGTYDKVACEKYINIKENEELICVIAVGYEADKQRLIEKIAKSTMKKKKSFDEILIEKDKEVTKWVREGIEFSQKAPSAVNKQPIGYKFEDNFIKAIIVKENHGYEDVDLGISMLHFELGAKKEGYNGKWNKIDKDSIYK